MTDARHWLRCRSPELGNTPRTIWPKWVPFGAFPHIQTGRRPMSRPCDYLLSVCSPELERSILQSGGSRNRSRSGRRGRRIFLCTCRAAARPDKHIQDKWKVAPAERWVFRLFVRYKLKHVSCTSLWLGIHLSAESVFFRTHKRCWEIIYCILFYFSLTHPLFGYIVRSAFRSGLAWPKMKSFVLYSSRDWICVWLNKECR